MRKFVHDFLKWLPVAIGGGAVAIAGVWGGARDWIEFRAIRVWEAMSDPWIAALVAIAIAGYLAAILWTGSEQRIGQSPRQSAVPGGNDKFDEPPASKLHATQVAADEINRLTALAAPLMPLQAAHDSLAAKRDLIEGLRRDVVRNARHPKRKHIRTYLGGHAGFQAIRKHLSQQFLDELEGSAWTTWGLVNSSDLNELEQVFLREIDGLELLWGIDHLPEPAPAIPINLNNLGAYVRGFPRVRELTKAIASDLDRPMDLTERQVGVSYEEQALALGFKTIADLDQALVSNRKLILRMAPYVIPEKIYHDFSLWCLFCVVGGSMGANAYWDIAKGLKYTSTSKGFCVEMEQVYGSITSY